MSPDVWTRPVVEKLIELYRYHECLWRITSKNYKNRNMREKALRDIEKEIGKMKPEIDYEAIKLKIQTIRNKHRREKNLVLAHIRAITLVLHSFKFL